MHRHLIESRIRISSTQFNGLEEYVEVKGCMENAAGYKSNVLVRICKLNCQEYPEIEGDGVAEIAIISRELSSRHYIGLSVKKSKGCALGSDTFFICPSCSNRFRYLYPMPEGLLCASCSGLYYESSPQRAARNFTIARHLRYKHRIELDDLKPKGMHYKTFNKLMWRIQILELSTLKRFT